MEQRDLVSARERYLSHIHSEYLEAIGQVVVQWSMLERTVEALIWQAAQLKPETLIAVTSQVQLPAKFDMLAALLHSYYPEYHAPFTRLANYVERQLRGRRNLFVHGVWASTADNYFALVDKKSARGKIKSQARRIEMEEAAGLSADIADVTVWLDQLSRRLPNPPPPGGIAVFEPSVHFKRLDPGERQHMAAHKAQALQPLP